MIFWLNERMTLMNFIPDHAAPCYDYLCTWNIQDQLARQLQWSDAGASGQRDALNDAMLFDSDAYHPLNKTCRSGLMLVVDDGWDVPKGTANLPGTPNVYGRCDPDTEKFPNYGDTPAQRLKTLSRKVLDKGYCGLGLWISPQISGEDANQPEMLERARAYWTERARWCAEAGIRYWKIDWGIHGHSVPYRTMLTEVLKQYAPDVIVEHAVSLPPFTELGNPPWRKQQTAEMLPISDVVRLYDVMEPLVSSSMLMRADEALSAASDYTANYDVAGILNGEDCASICAALGFAIGIMMENPADSGSEACIRWHRIAPPFSIWNGAYRTSEEILTDAFYFEEDAASWVKTSGKTMHESAPAVMARNCDLPQVETDGIRPFICASRHPETGACCIAAIKRTVNQQVNRPAPADVTFRIGNADSLCGVFGCFQSLTLEYDESIADRRVFAQDLMEDEAHEITELCRLADHRLTIPGDVLTACGRRARKPQDPCDPSCIIAIR